MTAGDTSKLSAFYSDTLLFAETGAPTMPSGQSPITFYGRFSAILDRDDANVWRVARLVVIRDSSVPPLSAR